MAPPKKPSITIPNIDFSLLTPEQFAQLSEQYERYNICIDCGNQFAQKKACIQHRKKPCLLPCVICRKVQPNKREKSQHDIGCQQHIFNHMINDPPYYEQLLSYDPIMDFILGWNEIKFFKKFVEKTLDDFFNMNEHLQVPENASYISKYTVFQEFLSNNITVGGKQCKTPYEIYPRQANIYLTGNVTQGYTTDKISDDSKPCNKDCIPIPEINHSNQPSQSHQSNQSLQSNESQESEQSPQDPPQSTHSFQTEVNDFDSSNGKPSKLCNESKNVPLVDPYVSEVIKGGEPSKLSNELTNEPENVLIVDPCMSQVINGGDITSLDTTMVKAYYKELMAEIEFQSLGQTVPQTNRSFDDNLMPPSDEITRRLNLLEPCTPEQVFTFVKNYCEDAWLKKANGKIRDKKYHRIYDQYLYMIEQLDTNSKTKERSPNTEKWRVQYVKDIIALSKELKNLRVANRCYIDERKDEQGFPIGIRDGHVFNVLSKLTNDNTSSMMNDFCAYGMSKDLCQASVNLIVKLYFNNGPDRIPFRVKDYKRMKIEYLRPDRTWATDMGGAMLGKLLCINLLRSLLITNMTCTQLALREERELEKSNLMSHYNISCGQHNLTLLRDSKFHLKVMRGLFSYLQNMDLNTAPSTNTISEVPSKPTECSNCSLPSMFIRWK